MAQVIATKLIATASSRRPVAKSHVAVPKPHVSQERLLLREMTHRINNEFASVISVVSLAAARSRNDEVKVALAAVQDRLQNYAHVHRVLQMPDHGTRIDAAAYMRQLCRAISRSRLDSKGIGLVLAEQPLRLNSERCWRLGMIVSELITNAARHAFGERGGEIRAELAASGTAVECRVTDNGMAAANIRPGHGTKIIEALAEGLDGRVEHDFGPNGTTSIVVFPANP